MTDNNNRPNSGFGRIIKRMLYYIMDGFNTIFFMIMGFIKWIGFFVMLCGFYMIVTHDYGYGVPFAIVGLVTYVLCHYIYDKYDDIKDWLYRESK